MAKRCRKCERDSCLVSAHSAAWKACRCDNDSACIHATEWRAADDDCVAHAINWRKRALAAEADLTALRERMRWVPVGERLPENDQDVSIFNGNVYAGWFECHFYDHEGRRFGGVTHWYPLPAAPEVQAVAAKTGRECPNCDNDEVFSDGDDQFEGTLHQCEQCGRWAAISVTAGRYALVDAPEVSPDVAQKCPQCLGTGWINAEGDSCDKDDPQSCGCPECACLCGGWLDDGGEHGNCMEVHNV